MKKLLIFSALMLSLVLAGTCQASLYDYFHSQNMPLPSVASRAKFAALAGIKGYTGTASQNTSLEAFLRGNLALNQVGSGGATTSTVPTNKTPYLNASQTWTNTNTFVSSTYFNVTSTFTGTTIINSSTQIGFQYMKIASTTGTSTWTRPYGVTRIRVRVIGGGGSALNGGSTNGYTDGAGGGGYAEKILDVSAISTTTITVGTYNATSSFGTYVLATPGSSTGIPGYGIGGDINSYGNPGSPTIAISTSKYIGGGGGSMLGGGAFSVGTYAAGTGKKDGNAGYLYGGGGGGCWAGSDGTCSGGAGAQGIVIIEY